MEHGWLWFTEIELGGKVNKMKKYLRYIAEFLLKRSFHKGIILGNHTQNGDQVRQEIDTLGSLFDFIHHDQLPECMAVKKKTKPFCLLTFDDGKKINAEESAPALEEMGIPAIFYLVTDHVSNGLPLWFDRRRAVVRSSGYEPDELKPKKLKKLSLERINKRLNRFCKKYSVEPDMTDPMIACMSWDDARNLVKKGFTIGAHTKTHPILPNESFTTAEDEICGSINAVKKNIGAACSTFAFPNGNYTDSLAEYAMTCGIKTVMTTEPLWVQKKFCLYRLPRIDIYNHYDNNKIVFKITAALPGCLLKNPNGTGRRYAVQN